MGCLVLRGDAAEHVGPQQPQPEDRVSCSNVSNVLTEVRLNVDGSKETVLKLKEGAHSRFW